MLDWVVDGVAYTDLSPSSSTPARRFRLPKPGVGCRSNILSQDDVGVVLEVVRLGLLESAPNSSGVM